MSNSEPILHDPHLLLRESNWLRRLARSLCSDRALAEDLSQDALLAAWQSRGEVRGPLRPWLAGVLRRIVANRERAQARQRRRECAVAQDGIAPATDEVVVRASQHRSVVESVMTLDEPYRTAILLRYFDDLSARDMAKRLDVPVETVRSRIKRGIGMLRTRLDRKHGDRAAWVGPLAAMAENNASTLALVGLMFMKTKIALPLILLVGIGTFYFWAGDAERSDPTIETTIPSELAGLPITSRGPVSDNRNESERSLATPTPAAVGELLIKVTFADNSVAPGIRVLVRERDRTNAVLAVRFARTDDHGVARVTGLVPSEYVAFANRRKAWILATVAAGEVQEVAIRLETGIDMSGIVVNRAGQPVAGADIVVAFPGMSLVHPAHIAAKSDSDGRFSLRAISIGSCVGARAAGYAPSRCRMFFRAHDEPVAALRLVMQGRGGMVVGRVEGSDGRPVAAALIRIGTEKAFWSPVYAEDGTTMVMPPFPINARTDSDGAFRVLGLDPGVRPIAVRAPGLAPWTGTCRAEPGGGPPLVVRLELPATCTGTVRDGEGRPVAKVDIRSGPRVSLAQLTTHTAADGSYRLAGLPAGKVQLSADHEVGHAETELEIVPGQALRWDVRFEKRAELRGRVLTERDEPVAEMNIQIRAITGAASRITRDMSTKTDAKGRFRVPNCPEKVQVAIRRGQGYTPVSRWVSVADGECVLRVTKLEVSSVTIRGRIVDARGEPVEGTRILWSSRDPRASSDVLAEVRDGKFSIGPLPPGTYRLRLITPGFPAQWTEERRLGPHEKWDMGNVRLFRGGRAKIRLDPAGIATTKPIRVSILSADDLRTIVRSIHTAGVSHTKRVVPGRYVLVLKGGNGIATQTIPFEAREGEDTELRMRLTRGHACEVRLATDADRLRIIVTSPRGLAYDRWVSRAPPAFKPTHIEIKLHLEAGRHTLTARTDAGQVARVKFTVTAGETTMVDVKAH